jgi:hypothetical protein
MIENTHFELEATTLDVYVVLSLHPVIVVRPTIDTPNRSL